MREREEREGGGRERGGRERGRRRRVVVVCQINNKEINSLSVCGDTACLHGDCCYECYHGTFSHLAHGKHWDRHTPNSTGSDCGVFL